MPTARKPCSAPGCPQLVTKGRCPAHRARAEQQRGSAGERGYDARWQRRRASYLRRHPWCARCGRPSKVADHWPVSRRALVAQGVPDPDADDRLRPLCTTCHNAETARRQPGGWHAEQQRSGVGREPPAAGVDTVGEGNARGRN